MSATTDRSGINNNNTWSIAEKSPPSYPDHSGSYESKTGASCSALSLPLPSSPPAPSRDFSSNDTPGASHSCESANETRGQHRTRAARHRPAAPPPGKTTVAFEGRELLVVTVAEPLLHPVDPDSALVVRADLIPPWHPSHTSQQPRRRPHLQKQRTPSKEQKDQQTQQTHQLHREHNRKRPAGESSNNKAGKWGKNQQQQRAPVHRRNHQATVGCHHNFRHLSCLNVLYQSSTAKAKHRGRSSWLRNAIATATFTATSASGSKHSMTLPMVSYPLLLLGGFFFFLLVAMGGLSPEHAGHPFPPAVGRVGALPPSPRARPGANRRKSGPPQGGEPSETKHRSPTTLAFVPPHPDQRAASAHILVGSGSGEQIRYDLNEESEGVFRSMAQRARAEGRDIRAVARKQDRFFLVVGRNRGEEEGEEQRGPLASGSEVFLWCHRRVPSSGTKQKRAMGGTDERAGLPTEKASGHPPAFSTPSEAAKHKHENENGVCTAVRLGRRSIVPLTTHRDPDPRPEEMPTVARSPYEPERYVPKQRLGSSLS